MSDAADRYYQSIMDAGKLLPAWFVPRMMDDEWSFGLLLVTGQVLHITHIGHVAQDAAGTIWIDANMNDDPPFQAWKGMKDLTAPTSRRTISINAAHVVAAFETADT